VFAEQYLESMCSMEKINEYEYPYIISHGLTNTHLFSIKWLTGIAIY